jgi:hypothetical protein
MRLGPLDAAAAAELARRTAGTAPLRSRMSAAAGNPRYVIAQALASPTGGPGGSARAGGRAGATGAGDEVLHDLVSLSDRARDVVEVTAVLPRPAGLEELAELLGIGREDGAAAVGEAVAHGVLRYDGHLVAFRHAMTHQAVLDGLPSAVRTALESQARHHSMRACGTGDVRACA